MERRGQVGQARARDEGEECEQRETKRIGNHSPLVVSLEAGIVFRMFAKPGAMDRMRT